MGEGGHGGVGQGGEEGDEGAGEGGEDEGAEAKCPNAGAGVGVGHVLPPAAMLSHTYASFVMSCPIHRPSTQVHLVMSTRVIHALAAQSGRCSR